MRSPRRLQLTGSLPLPVGRVRQPGPARYPSLLQGGRAHSCHHRAHKAVTSASSLGGDIRRTTGQRSGRQREPRTLRSRMPRRPSRTSWAPRSSMEGGAGDLASGAARAGWARGPGRPVTSRFASGPSTPASCLSARRSFVPAFGFGGSIAQPGGHGHGARAVRAEPGVLRMAASRGARASRCSRGSWDSKSCGCRRRSGMPSSRGCGSRGSTTARSRTRRFRAAVSIATGSACQVVTAHPMRLQ